MKKLLVVVLFFISLSSFAQYPQIFSGSVVVQGNASNVYYVDYSQFVTQGIACPMSWGIGYVDLITSTRPLDSYVDAQGFDCSAWFNSTYFRFEPDGVGLPGTVSYYTITYQVLDVCGNRSNIGQLTLRVEWPDTGD